MAGLTPSLQQQQQQHHLLTGSAVSGTSATPGEEDAFKRNTDCVYFLASPLTCKKGSECEYRHSEIARLNPRDCYYWMNGNCLNPKCGFRHPPLEGLLGAQAPTPVGVSVPPNLAASTPVAPASFGPGPGKQPVPCIFFQKGYCMKGDWCPFLHAPPNSVSYKVLPSQAPATTAESATLRKPFGGPEKVTQQKMPPQVNVPKAVELPSQAKPTPRVGYAPSKDEPSKERKHPASSVGDELSRQRTSGVPSFDNGTHVSWSSRVQQPVSLMDNVIIMNGKDAEEEISREPSPGFDVLVDNELEDSAYYPSEDQFGRPDDREGGNEYFDRHSGDYKSMVDTEPDIYHETRGYDSYERHQGQYAWEQRRSSERMLSGLPVNREKSRRSRTRSPDPVHDSDLRYRLSKQSRTSGLRSVIHQDDARERPDHRSYQKSQRDVHRDHERRDNSLGSSRLRGRIKMPGHSSSDIGNELQRGRNTDWPRPQTGGLSQGRFQHPSRLQNRIKDTIGVEDGLNNYRNDRSLPIRRETRNDADFAPPKRLSELRSRKTVETNDQHVNHHQTSDSKRKHSKVEYPQDVSGDHLSFDGPKPLQEILKRKRVNEKSDSGSSDGNLYNNRNKMEESLMNHADKASEQETENAISKSTSSGVNKIEKESALLTDEAEVGEVGEMMVEDGEVGGDEEAENYAAEDDVEYYEQVDGEEEAYELDEGDNGGDPEGEYLDEDDDDDDFAKKMGVMY